MYISHNVNANMIYVFAAYAYLTSDPEVFKCFNSIQFITFTVQFIHFISPSTLSNGFSRDNRWK